MNFYLKRQLDWINHEMRILDSFRNDNLARGICAPGIGKKEISE